MRERGREGEREGGKEEEREIGWEGGTSNTSDVVKGVIVPIYMYMYTYIESLYNHMQIWLSY